MLGVNLVPQGEDSGCETNPTHSKQKKYTTLPETSIFAPENGWLEYLVSFWNDLFSGATLVSGRVP